MDKLVEKGLNLEPNVSHKKGLKAKPLFIEGSIFKLERSDFGAKKYQLISFNDTPVVKSLVKIFGKCKNWENLECSSIHSIENIYIGTLKQSLIGET